MKLLLLSFPLTPSRLCFHSELSPSSFSFPFFVFLLLPPPCLPPSSFSQQLSFSLSSFFPFAFSTSCFLVFPSILSLSFSAYYISSFSVCIIISPLSYLSQFLRSSLNASVSFIFSLSFPAIIPVFSRPLLPPSSSLYLTRYFYSNSSSFSCIVLLVLLLVLLFPIYL